MKYNAVLDLRICRIMKSFIIQLMFFNFYKKKKKLSRSTSPKAEMYKLILSDGRSLVHFSSSSISAY